uniref:Uncharacterized protein n=1 Tax=Anguilla anguilla TaxID=7936 RepID=A0A0E9VPN4_ANGAN
MQAFKATPGAMAAGGVSVCMRATQCSTEESVYF